jgi:hypothetical protein
MKLYFVLSQIPEMKPLSKRQRKAVYQGAMLALFAEQPAVMWTGGYWILGGLAGGAVAGRLAVAGGVAWQLGALGKTLPVIIAGGVAGAVLGVFLGGQWMTKKLRPYYRRVLEERAEELARIG